MTTLKDRYPEIEMDGESLPMQRLMQDLDRLGNVSRTSAVPPENKLRITDALQHRATKLGRHSKPGHRSYPRFRLSRPVALVGALVCILLLAGATYSAITVLNQAFGMNPGTQRIVTSNLGRSLGLTRSVDGFTVTIGRVYADANQIVIGYTIGGPPKRTFNSLLPFAPPHPQIPSLTDSAGREFAGGPVSWGTGVQDGHVGGVLVYQPTGITGAPKTLKLHLAFDGLSAVERIGDDPSSIRYVTVHQAFSFTFTVPFDAGRVAELQDTTTIRGTTVTLQRVAVTKTETRITLRGAGPYAEVQLSVDGSTYALNPEGASPAKWTPDSLWSYATPTSLTDKRGQWTLVVKPGHGPPGGTEVTGGPWVFHFVVP